MGKIIRTVILVLNLPIYYFVFMKFFKSKEEIMDAFKYYFQLDIISVARGEMLKDMKLTQKVGMCLLICILIFVFEDFIISHLFEYLGFNY